MSSPGPNGSGAVPEGVSEAATGNGPDGNGMAAMGESMTSDGSDSQVTTGIGSGAAGVGATREPAAAGADDTAAPGAAADDVGVPAAGTTTAGTTATDSATANGTGQESATDGDGTEGTEPGKTPATVRRRRRRRRSFWREFPILVVVALLLAVVIKTYALQAFFIPSGSMENTLKVNDRVLINKVVYDFRGIHRGDIVVFNGDGSWDPGSVPVSSNVVSEFFASLTGMFGFGHRGDIYVKRVIGLPGDDVACCDAKGQVTVNGAPLTEGSYLFSGDVPSMSRFNIVVPKDRLWVMGDHRSVSDDSRGHPGDPGGGTIPESAVLGRAFVIIWPPSRWRFLPIPSTFSQPALDKRKATAQGADFPADLLGARLQPEGSAVPLSLGFAGAVPLTLALRGIRLWPGKRRGRGSP